MRYYSLLMACLCLVGSMLLGACDGMPQGWETKYKGDVSEDSRTAGWGLDRVLSRMKRGKGPVLDPFLYGEPPPLAPPSEPAFFPPKPNGSLPPMYISKKIVLPEQLRPEIATHIPSLVGGRSQPTPKIMITKDAAAEPLAMDEPTEEAVIEEKMVEFDLNEKEDLSGKMSKPTTVQKELESAIIGSKEDSFDRKAADSLAKKLFGYK